MHAALNHDRHSASAPHLTMKNYICVYLATHTLHTTIELLSVAATARSEQRVCSFVDVAVCQLGNSYPHLRDWE